jgi:hypothetical protein
MMVAGLFIIVAAIALYLLLFTTTFRSTAQAVPAQFALDPATTVVNSQAGEMQTYELVVSGRSCSITRVGAEAGPAAAGSPDYRIRGSADTIQEVYTNLCRGTGQY